MVALLALATAGEVRLVEGTPEFQNCLSNPDCNARFHDFLGQSMAEQGFAMQAHSLLGVSLWGDGGWTVGAQVGTFPFGDPAENLSGKEENTQFSPVFPRIRAAYGVGDATMGFTLVPPVPVGGASAFATSLDLSRSVRRGMTRLTVQGEWSFVRARAPVVASEEQFENRESFDNPANLLPETYEAVCVPAGGCVDTYRNGTGTLRGLASWSVGPATPYVGVGAGYSGHALWVMYDDTAWRIDTWQASAHGGTGLSFGPVRVNVGASVAPIPPSLQQDDVVFYKLDGGAGLNF